MWSVWPAIGQLLPVLGVDTALLQVMTVLENVFVAFPGLRYVPIGQFTVQDFLWESGYSVRTR